MRWGLGGRGLIDLVAVKYMFGYELGSVVLCDGIALTRFVVICVVLVLSRDLKGDVTQLDVFSQMCTTLLPFLIFQQKSCFLLDGDAISLPDEVCFFGY